jgi:hypothetical protein
MNEIIHLVGVAVVAFLMGAAVAQSLAARRRPSPEGTCPTCGITIHRHGKGAGVSFAITVPAEMTWARPPADPRGES